MDAVTLVGAALMYLGATFTIGVVSWRILTGEHHRVELLLSLVMAGIVFVVPAIAFDRFAVPPLVSDAASPLVSAAVYTVGVTVTTVTGLAVYWLGRRLSPDEPDTDTSPPETKTRARTGITLILYTALVAAVALARDGLVSPLTAFTLVVVGVTLYRILRGGEPRADGYRSPTDAEARRIAGCFDRFDASPGTVVVYSIEDTDSPQCPGVFVATGLGRRMSYVHEELLDVATDDELAVAFAQATHRSPLTYVLTAALQSIALLLGVSVLVMVNTLTLWAFDIGLAMFGGPPLPLVLTVSGLFASFVAIHKLSRWSFTAADDFACRHLGATTVSRTYRALGDALAANTELSDDDRGESGEMEPPLVRRLERLAGDRTEDGRPVAVTEWFFATVVAGGLWMANILGRPVAVAATTLAATPSGWLVDIGSATVGLVLAGLPLLVVHRRHALLDSLPAALRSELNTRWEFPVVVVASLFVTDLVVNGYLSVFWLCLAGLALFATGVSYRSRYYPYLNDGEPPAAATATRLRSCLEPDQSVDGIRIYESLNQYDIFVTGDETHRTLHVERSVLEIDDDSHLAVALAEGYERARQFRGAGRASFFLIALCPVVLAYGVVLLVGGNGIGAGLIVAGLLLLVVLLFVVRRIAGRFFRIDRRLCERYGSETVRAAYDSVGPHIAHQKASGFAWRVWLSPYPSIESRLSRFPEPDGREPPAEPVSS